MKIFNPLENKSNYKRNNGLALTASNMVPNSPISGEPMQIVQCGTHDGPNFKIWVHLKDRIAIPYRDLI